MIVNQQVSPDSYRYSPLFSFFDYYSDALNDIAHYSDPKGNRLFQISCIFRLKGDGTSLGEHDRGSPYLTFSAVAYEDIRVRDACRLSARKLFSRLFPKSTNIE